MISQQASLWVVSVKWLFELCGRENHHKQLTFSPSPYVSIGVEWAEMSRSSQFIIYGSWETGMCRGLWDWQQNGACWECQEVEKCSTLCKCEARKAESLSLWGEGTDIYENLPIVLEFQYINPIFTHSDFKQFIYTSLPFKSLRSVS